MSTDQTLLQQMRITEADIEGRKLLLGFSEADAATLLACRPLIEKEVHGLVSDFYTMQTSIDEIALLIGDADTLNRLRKAQSRYVLDLFDGVYDLEYVNNRLRIGLVHKRIGVEPKLYLAAIHSLKSMLFALIRDILPDQNERRATLNALDKLLSFDITLVFETYIRSLVSEIEIAKTRAEEYAHGLERKTQQLEELSRTDSLTGLMNRRFLFEQIMKAIRAAQRRSEPLSLVYIDVNNFKEINDTLGHQTGDQVLQSIGQIIRQSCRGDDTCFRYGGDEFCIVLANCHEQEARDNFCLRVQEALKELDTDVTLSIGIVQTGPKHYSSPEQMIRLADSRMYDEKRSFKNDSPPVQFSAL